MPGPTELDPGLVVLLVAAAAYRLARFVARDTITLGLRSVVFRWAFRLATDEERADRPDELYVARSGWRTYPHELVNCAHCIGVWAAVGMLAAWETWTWAGWAVVALAAAGVQSAVVTALPDRDRE